LLENDVGNDNLADVFPDFIDRGKVLQQEGTEFPLRDGLDGTGPLSSSAASQLSEMLIWSHVRFLF
jgi:hypothetical protein